VLDACERLILTIDEIAAAAGPTMSAIAGEKADSDPLPHSPSFDAVAQRIDPTDCLVAWNARPLNRKYTLNCPRIRMADSAGLHANANMARRRVNEWLVHEFEFARTYRLHCTIGFGALTDVRLPSLPILGRMAATLLQIAGGLNDG
jgi:hypothetical protein